MHNRNRTGRRLAALTAALVVLLGMMTDVQTVSALDAGAKKKESWKIEKQCVFYYKGGKKLTGLRKLNGKYYYF